jgi:rhodanese-related sulfurtransferase
MKETISTDRGASVPDVDREALRARLARGDAFRLVMAARDWAFRAKHIPGSLHFKSDGELYAGLAKSDDIVVYCSNIDCHASLALIEKLRAHGYEHLTHYRGGLIDWEEAGLPVEGDWASGASR